MFLDDGRTRSCERRLSGSLGSIHVGTDFCFAIHDSIPLVGAQLHQTFLLHRRKREVEAVFLKGFFRRSAGLHIEVHETVKEVEALFDVGAFHADRALGERRFALGIPENPFRILVMILTGLRLLS